MRFSIIVPIYNIEEYIEQCVNSLLMQNYDNYEIILVDDGGKDRCPQICDEFAQRSNKIKVIHKNNGGLVSARNAGVEIATGDYIGYVDGDDWVEPNLLYRLNEILKHNQVDVINFGFYNNIDGIDKKEPNCKHKGLFDKNLLEKYVFPSMIFDEAEGFYSFGVIPAVWCKFYKESVLRENLCKDDKITFGEDVACSYFCLLSAKSVYFCDDLLYHYRRNRTSMTKAYNANMFENCRHLIEYLDINLDTIEYQIPKQKKEYKTFILFKCVLNEARSSDTIKLKIGRLEDRLKKYDWLQFIKQIDYSSYSFPYKVFFKLLKQKKYALLLIVCGVLLRIHG